MSGEGEVIPIVLFKASVLSVLDKRYCIRISKNFEEQKQKGLQIPRLFRTNCLCMWV